MGRRRIPRRLNGALSYFYHQVGGQRHHESQQPEERRRDRRTLGEEPTTGNSTKTPALESWLLNAVIVARFSEGTREFTSSLTMGQKATTKMVPSQSMGTLSGLLKYAKSR